MLDKNVETFVIYITSWLSLILIDLVRKIQITLLFVKKVKISIEYLDFSNIFLKKKTLILLEIIKLNQYAINL